jgi:hypothetical protein
MTELRALLGANQVAVSVRGRKYHRKIGLAKDTDPSLSFFDDWAGRAQ